MKYFNTTGICIPEKHYMVPIDRKLAEIKAMVDRGDYFVINRARQYGKTTTLSLLEKVLQKEYIVISLDFQKMSNVKFANEYVFAAAFAEYLYKTITNKRNPIKGIDSGVLEKLLEDTKQKDNFALTELFDCLTEMCDSAEKPMVLMIDEVDSASNNQVFLDFLAQLRLSFMNRDKEPSFQSVILAGVHDIRNLKRKLRSEEEHKLNSPWNIAKAFLVDMSFSAEEITGMLKEYEADHQTGMDIAEVAESIFDYTSGYPFLVSLICETLDTNISKSSGRLQGNAAWSREGVSEAVKVILQEKVTLFESMTKQIETYPELKELLQRILFEGQKLMYSPDNAICSLGQMFGYIKNQDGIIAVSNRIFETRLYNFFISEAQLTDISYKEAQKDKSQFIKNGMLDMERVLEKFVSHFHDVYSGKDEEFIESHGRKFFLLYLKPIINGTGNYYVEAETRDARRTDIIVDYLGKQFVIELKIWHGEKYQEEGRLQLSEYLDRYHQKKGYLLTFSFNKNKEVGVKNVQYKDKEIIEAVV